MKYIWVILNALSSLVITIRIYGFWTCEVRITLKFKGLFARHVKEPWVYVEVEITGKIDRPFLARNSVFR